MKYVALLRGINVGGNNIIKMVDLRAAFEAMGFDEVATYIQSGNVAFAPRGKALAPQAAKAKLVTKIEKALGATFGYAARVAVVSAEELATVIAEAPTGFGTQPDTYRYDVMFLMPPLTSAEVLAQLKLRAGVDAADGGSHAVYFRRLISKATQSYLNKLVQMPIYKQLTVRNWNTTVRLAALSR